MIHTKLESLLHKKGWSKTKFSKEAKIARSIVHALNKGFKIVKHKKKKFNLHPLTKMDIAKVLGISEKAVDSLHKKVK